MLTIVTMFVGWFSVVYRQREEDFALIVREHAKEYGPLLDRLIELSGKPLCMFSRDYTYWDDMVVFVETGASKWARENLDTALTTFGADALWVYRSDWSPVYFAAGDETAISGHELPIAELAGSDFAEQRFAHFFIPVIDGVMEIRGATIHPTDDEERKTAPRGFFFTGRIWDEKFVNGLAGLIGGRAAMKRGGGAKSAMETKDLDGTICLTRNLHDRSGRVLAELDVEVDIPLAGELAAAPDWALTWGMLFSFTILAVLWIGISRWLIRPLRLLAVVLDAEDPAPLKKIEGGRTEFGAVARLIEESFRRKEKLRREIERRELAEADIRRYERNLEITLNSIGDGVIATDADGKVTLMNPVAEKLTGWCISEAKGKPLPEVFRIISELTRKTVESPVAKVLREGKIVELANHTLLIAKDGSECPIADSGAPIIDETGGKIAGVVLVFRDQTAERNAQKKIEHLNAILLAIRNVNQLITKEKDPAHLIEKTCRCLTETRGYVAARIVLSDSDMRAASAACESPDKKGFAQLRKALEAKGFAEYEKISLSSRDPVIFASDAAEIVNCPFGVNISGYEAMTMRIEHLGKLFGTLSVLVPEGMSSQTEEYGLFMEVADDLGFALDAIEKERKRKEAEKNVGELKRQIEFILGATKTGLDIIDSDFNIRYIDPAWRKAYGNPAGKKCYEYFMDRDAVCPGCGIVKALATKRIAVTEETLPKEGNRMVEVTTIPFRDEAGEWLVAEVNVDITERRKNEAELRESEERHRVLFESSREAIMTLAPPTWKFTSANPAALRLFGAQDRAEFVSVLPSDVSPVFQPDGRPSAVTAKEMIESAMEEGSRFFEWTHKRLNGEEFLATVLLTRIVIGGKASLQATVRDITEQRRSEEALRASEKRFRTTLDNMLEGCQIIDREWRYVYLNDTAARHGRKKKERILGQKIMDVYPDFDKTEIFRIMKECMDGRISRITENEFVYNNGEKKWFELSIQPTHEGIFVLSLDIDARKRAEHVFRETERKQKAILDNITDIAWLKDENSRFIMANEPFAAACGFEADWIAGKTDYDVWPEELAAKYAADDGEVMRSGKQKRVEEQIKGRDGAMRWIETVKTPIFDERGKVIGTTGIARDVTERKNLEAQLSHANKMEAVGGLAAGIAHEINTPIQYIGDNARFLKDSFGGVFRLLDAYRAAGAAGEKRGELFREAEALADEIDIAYAREEIPASIDQSIEGVARVANIVRAMREFAHPDSGDKIAIDVNRAVESTVTVARNEWKYVAEMKTALDPDLPPISCMPGDINQVLLNMVVNAAHAIGERKQNEPEHRGEISISTGRAADWIEIRIGDTGTGIPKEIRDRIFDPFFTTKAVGKGTGQGLSIAYNIVVKKHGGEIAVETEPGKGTVFIVRLPLAKDTAGKETT